MPYPPQPDIWLDIGKTFVGAFFGAGFAFASTLLVQWRQRRKENIKSGNLALAVLREMINAFINVRSHMQAMRDLVLRVSPGAPLWLYYKPTTHPFDSQPSFDLPALSFLFDKHGVEAVQKLSLAQSNYRSLCMLVAAHRETKEQIQAKLAGLGVVGGTMIPAGIEGKLGSDLIEKANDLTTALLRHFERDEAIYDDAVAFLKGELVRRYGKRFLSIVPRKGISMSEDQAERKRLYEKTRDEISASTRTQSESLDRSLLTLSSAFLGGSLAFINPIVGIDAASYKWMLYVSWAFFVLTIVVTIASLIFSILQLRPLHDAAHNYYIEGDQAAWAVSDVTQRRIFRLIIGGGVIFAAGIFLLALFVALNLAR